MSVTFQLQTSAGANEFGVRLKKRDGQEFVGDLGWFAVGPAMVEQVRPGTGRRVAYSMGDLGELSWSSFFYQREKCREAGQKLWSIRRIR